MAFSMTLTSCFFSIILVLQILLSDLTVAFVGPKLNISTYEYILKTGENFTVLCEGNGQLKWRVKKFEDNGEYSKYTTVQIVNSTAQNEGFTTAVELRITNATFKCVGMYYCMNEKDDGSGPAILYLYVYDANYLAVKNAFYSKIIKQGDVVTIPCIPTAPDVQVTIAKGFEDEQSLPIELGKNSEGKYYKFSQLAGFTTDDTTQIQLMTYRCDYQRENFSVSYVVQVDVEPQTHSISEPSIEVLHPKLRNTQGETMNLKCSVRSHVRVDITWIFPDNFQDHHRTKMSNNAIPDLENLDHLYGTLTIRNTSRKDSGIYTCQVRDYQGHKNWNSINITIFEHFSDIYLIDRGCSIKKNGEFINTTCSVEVNGHPLPNVTWLNNRNETIPVGTSQYIQEINSTNLVAWLEIVNVTTSDAGIFTMIAVNEYDNRNLTIFVDVIKKPTIELRLEGKYQMEYREILVECIVTSYPKPFVELMFKPCLDDSCRYRKLENIEYDETENILSASVTNSFKKSGVIKCVASETVIGDSDGQTYEAERALYISDIPNGFELELLGGFHQSYDFVVLTFENSLEIQCSAYIQNFTQRITWKRDSKKLTSNEKYQISTTSTDFSNSSILNISDININDKGFYTCELYRVTGDNEEIIKTENVFVAVSSYIAPVLVESNLNSTIEITDGSYLELICVFKGKPPPIITWYKNNGILTSSTTRSISKDGQKLAFSSITKEEEGLYECEGKNTWGIRTKETKLIFKYNSGFKLYGIIIGLLTLLVIVGSVTTLINHFSKKKLEKLLVEAGLANFEEGQLDNLNPELGIVDQVDCLPYDRSYEFPFKKLKLGKILGSGAFGVVVLGEAKGILPHKEVTTVAVKMVDRNAQNVHIKALVAELKILIHLGKHLNVISLLGACTKNIAKKKLLVIEEYCKYGNLQTYLYRRRKNFVHELNPSTGSTNLRLEEESSSTNDLTWFNVSNGTSAESAGVIHEPTCSAYSLKNMNEDEEQKLEHNCEENERSESISTADLLSWSFQVARGMEYLVSRRVLHGDLAARNILLADDNVVKICDFGLAKRTYQMEVYKKSSDGPLPVKWMAVESIRDRIFSSQSDVWSFGIVLWEFFSLAKIPYPGMEADEKLFEKLENGYRMESPKYSNPKIYQIMLDSWSANPLNRPTFTQLSERLGLMLEDSVRAHYIQLNDTYLMMNANRIESKKNDYLNMVAPSSFQRLSSPQNHINETITSSGYVQMTAKPFIL